MGKLSRTSSVHFVPSRKEVSDTVIDVIVDGPVCSLSAAIAEVRRPAAQKAVQFITHFRPRSDVAGNQEFTDFVLDPLHALRGWACTQVPTAVFSVAMWSERVSKKVETLPPSVLQRGFGLVDCQPEPRHHDLCPRQRFSRASATEDDEVISIGDDLRTKSFPRSREPPVFQKAIHIHVGEQRTYYSPYAKGNFSFERVISHWRRGLSVLDLRLKK
jgi:hypothetical protein